MLMKRQGSYGNLNFIDRNDNYVGWDDQQDCCEQHGYFISPTVGTELDAEPDVDGYFWDVLYEPHSVEHPYITDCGGMVVFRMVNDAGDFLYLHLYNDHNGYYSHGWSSTFSQDKEGYL